MFVLFMQFPGNFCDYAASFSHNLQRRWWLTKLYVFVRTVNEALELVTSDFFCHVKPTQAGNGPARRLAQGSKNYVFEQAKSTMEKI